MAGGKYGYCITCSGRGWKPLPNYNGLPDQFNTVMCNGGCDGTGRSSHRLEDYENSGGNVQNSVSASGFSIGTLLVVILLIYALFFQKEPSYNEKVIQRYQTQVLQQQAQQNAHSIKDTPAEIKYEKEREARNLKWAQQHRVPPSEVESGD